MQAVRYQDTALPKPCWPPTKKDWSTHKALITYLYIEKDFKLDHIRSHLQTHYGFKATDRMYKARFKRWKLRKYFSARDKEAVAQLLEVYRRNGAQYPEVRLNENRVPLHVIRRYCRRNRIFEEICDDLPYIPEVKSFSTAPNITSLDEQDLSQLQHMVLSSAHIPPPAPLRRPMSLETDLDNVQRILTLTSIYFRWHLGCDLTEEQFQVSTRPSAVSWRQFTRFAMHASSFWELIGHGVTSLVDNNPKEAWGAFNKGCTMVEAILHEQHRGLLKLIYLLFSDQRWQDLPDLRLAILRFFSNMSAKVLGENHPLSIIVRLCKDPAVFRSSSQRILKVILDISCDLVGEDAPEIGQLKRAHCDILRMNGVYGDAMTEANALIENCEALYGPNDEQTRRALRRLAHILLDQGRDEDAESVYLDVVERSHQELADDYPDESCILAYQNLADIAHKRGNLTRSEAYWRLAYGGAVYLFGIEHLETELCRRKLAEVLSMLDKPISRDWMHKLPCTSSFERRLSAPMALDCGEAEDWAPHSTVFEDQEL